MHLNLVAGSELQNINRMRTFEMAGDHGPRYEPEQEARTVGTVSLATKNTARTAKSISSGTETGTVGTCRERERETEREREGERGRES